MDSNQSTLFKIWERGSHVSVGLIHPNNHRGMKVSDFVRSDVKDALEIIETLWKVFEDGIIANIDREVGDDFPSKRGEDSDSSRSRKRTGDSVSSDSDPRKRRRGTDSPFPVGLSAPVTLSFEEILAEQGITGKPFEFSFGTRKRARDDGEEPSGGDMNATVGDLGLTDIANLQRMKRVKVQVKKETED